MAKKAQRGEPALTPSQIKKIAETASQIVIESYRQEAARVREENHDRRLYNTRLLMEKYRGLERYSEDAIYSASQIDEDTKLQSIIELMKENGDNTNFSIESIQTRVARTRVVLDHVDKMLAFYRFRCENSGKIEIQRKWETVKALYIDEEEKTVQELAEQFCVDERTVYRYNKAAMQDLSALFFGVID